MVRRLTPILYLTFLACSEDVELTSHQPIEIWPPVVPVPTKMWAQQETIHEDDPNGCQCELTDLTDNARLHCFFGICTGCKPFQFCERQCWSEYVLYMEGDDG